MQRGLLGLVAAFVLISSVAGVRLEPRGHDLHHDAQRKVVHTDAAEADRVEALPGWEGAVNGLFSGASLSWLPLQGAVQLAACNQTVLLL